MAGNLTTDISSLPDEVSMQPPRVGGTGTDFNGWYFEGDFGVFTDKILSVMAAAFDETFREEPPFYYDFPQLSGFSDKPSKPLAFDISFGFNEDRDQHEYRGSVCEHVAVGFDGYKRYGEDTYDMPADVVERFAEFSAALRELADKIDVELTKVTISED